MSPVATSLIVYVILTHLHIKAEYKEGYDPKPDWKSFCTDEFKCQKKYEHSTCKYKCEIGPDCQEFKAWELDNERRQYVLDLHNFYRNLVAVGNETRGALVSSSNMKALNYERAHEPVAHCWQRRCTWGHDECRGIKGINKVGQNAMSHNKDMKKEHQFLSGFWIINRSVWSWYEEVAFMIEGDIEDARDTVPGSPEQIGHVTQVLWAETHNIGCSLTRHKDLKTAGIHKWFFFCNYGKAGNFVKKPVYLRGPPASKCDMWGLQKSEEYAGLCGDMYSVSKKRRPIVAVIDGVEHKHVPVDTGKENIIPEDDSLDYDYDQASDLRVSIMSLATPILIFIHANFDI